MIADTFCRYPVIHDEEELKRQRAIAFLKRMYGKEYLVKQSQGVQVPLSQFPTSPIRRITTGVYTSERGLNLSKLRHVAIVNIFL